MFALIGGAINTYPHRHMRIAYASQTHASHRAKSSCQDANGTHDCVEDEKAFVIHHSQFPIFGPYFSTFFGLVLFHD